jgi:microcystin-dependent protein
MASTYVNDLRLEEIGTGEASGTWGTKTNANLELIGEAFSYGSEAIADASTHTITIADGTSDQARSFYLKCTGGGQACTVTLAPNTVSKVWMIENATSATLTFSQGSGANVAVAAGEVKMIATDGGGGDAIVYDLLTDANLAGTTAIAALKLAGTTVTSTGAELNILDGVTASAAEINILTGVTSTAAELNYNDTGAGVGTVVASKTVTADANKDVASLRNLTITGELDAATLDISGAVDIDGAIQLDATFTVGVDDTGYDVKFFGDTASAFMQWDASADDLILGGAAGIVIPDGNLTLGSTAVTATAAELNFVDGVTSSIQTQISALSQTPAGSIIYHAANSAPTGFLKANGATVSRSTYANLFSAIGTTFGAGDGSTTFLLPDLRGEFMRGWDDSRGIDGSRAFGSAQADQMEEHNHITSNYPLHQGYGGGTGALVVRSPADTQHGNLSTILGNRGGTSNSSENRPRNVALLACIKH